MAGFGPARIRATSFTATRTSCLATSTIATPGAVQRIEVIGDHRDPARILATGASSGRDVSVADGDVYVAGWA